LDTHAFVLGQSGAGGPKRPPHALQWIGVKLDSIPLHSTPCIRTRPSSSSTQRRRTQPDSRRRFFVFLAAPALHLLAPPLALGTQPTEAALRLGLSATAGQPQARRRQRLPLRPLASRLRPPHTGRRPCVRTSLSPPASAGRSTAPGPCGCAARRARPAGSGSQQPLLHQGGRAALGALMPHRP
jgi:hypothetical protein